MCFKYFLILVWLIFFSFIEAGIGDAISSDKTISIYENKTSLTSSYLITYIPQTTFINISI